MVINTDFPNKSHTDTPMPAPSPPLEAVTFRVYSKNVNNKLGCALWKSGVRRSEGDGAAG